MPHDLWRRRRICQAETVVAGLSERLSMIAAHLRKLVVVFLAGWIAGNGQTTPVPASAATQKSASPEFSVAGVVNDPSGAVIQGASVALKGGRGQERSAVTDTG